MTLDDTLLTELKELAARRRVPLKQAVDQALRAGLQAIRRPGAKSRVRPRVFAMGAPRVSLDKALAMAATLEEEEITRKLEARK